MGDSLGLSAEEVLMTTRSVRKRLDLERPVDRQTVIDCIEIAHQAPTGSNAQGWSWMIVDDPEKKKVIADHYRDIYWPYREANSRLPEDDAQGVRISESANHLANVLDQVPVHVIPLHRGRLEGAESFRQASAWGSILPAVWSFMLALRTKGLGSAWTTLHLPREREVADLLGIPFDTVMQTALSPLAFTRGTDFKPARGREPDTALHVDAW